MEVNEILTYEEDIPEYYNNEDKLRRFFSFKQVIAPVFFNTKERKQCVLVHIVPKTMTATLYYRPSIKHDNGKQR